MTTDPILDSTIERLRRSTYLSRIEVLAIMAYHAWRMAVEVASGDDMAEIAHIAEARRRITAAIDREIAEGL